MRSMLHLCAIAIFAAPAVLGCGGSHKPQPTEITAAAVPPPSPKVTELQSDITRLEKERDDARRTADEERNRHVQYVLLQQDRNELEDKALSRLAEIDAYVLKLEEKANKATGAVRAHVEREVGDALKAREGIERDLRRVHTETDKAFAQLKSDVEKRLDALYTRVREEAEKK